MLAGDKVYLLVLLAEVVQRAKDDFDVNFQLDILRVVVEALVEAGYLEEAQQLRLELNDEAITVPVVSPEKHIEEQEFSLRALQTELANTCFKGRDALFALLERSTFDLSAIDQGKTLWKIYTAMQQMNSWFGLPVKAAPQLSQ